MSPHGSKIRELVRYLANLLLTDSQRKKIKNALARLQRIPIKALGVEHLIDSQHAEIERLKSRQVILEGKLNLALYGLPRVGEYRANLISSSLLSNERFLSDSISREYPEHLQTALRHSWLAELRPKACFAFGASNPAIVRAVLETYSGIETLRLCETHPRLLEAIKGEFGASPGVELVEADPLTSLASQCDMRFDFIAIIQRFQQMSPLEQEHFLRDACGRLNPGGILFLDIPDLSNPKVSQDLYWAEPYNLRPVSISFIKGVLSRLDGNVEMIRGDEMLSVLFKKGRP